MLTLLMNRLGDVGILMVIAWMMNFGGWHFMFYLTYGWGFWILILIILAGFTKSAQIPFSSWLPAAMAAPTPVSSLVHSSTLVTAGVYLFIRFFPLFCLYNMSFFLLLSVMTMVFSGISANFEYDLSSVIALSTLSQLGMMMSVLFIGYPDLAFFHLLVHAFFKALLFLCSGCMIHCMGDNQDLRYMGFLLSTMPYTCCCFCISILSMCGFPFLSGFYSSDSILEQVLFDGSSFFFFFFFSAGLTAAYSVRLIYYSVLFNMNCSVCIGYCDDLIMMSSLLLLVLVSVIFGGCLSWLLFKVPCFIVLSIFLSVMSFVCILFGSLMGYVTFFFSESFYFLFFFMGSMWFLPLFSFNYLGNYFLYLSVKVNGVMDSGWGEYLISSVWLDYFSFLSYKVSFYQFNNVSVFMLVFLLFLFVLLI